MGVLDVLFPRVRTRLFRELFDGSGREIHLRQLARSCGVAIGTMQDEVALLKKTGLIRSRQQGNRLLLRAHDNHPLYPEIRQIIGKTTRPRSKPRKNRDPNSPQPPVEIRPARSTDRTGWLRMRRKLWAGHADHARETRAYFSHPQAHAVVLVAETPGGSLAGFLELGQRDMAEGCVSSPVAYVEGWWVEELHRRTGVGRALLRGAEAWASKRGLNEIASDCTPDNRPSAAAHAACGYRETGCMVCFRKIL